MGCDMEAVVTPRTLYRGRGCAANAILILWIFLRRVMEDVDIGRYVWDVLWRPGRRPGRRIEAVDRPGMV